MEFVLAFLLFFGGLALGENFSAKAKDALPSPAVLSDADALPDSHRPAQAMRQSDPILCYSGEATIYKDLTEPYLGQIDQREIQSLCGEDCPDE